MRLSDPQRLAILPLVRALASRHLVCIGATAVAHHVPLGRNTLDVDFALRATPSELIELVRPLGFVRDERMWHRFHAPNGVMIDLMPYDDTAISRTFLEVEPGRRLGLVGFDLLRATADPVLLGGPDTVRLVAGLAVLVVLKMIAYVDRPSGRQKDLHDLAAIFERVLSDHDERRWNDEMVEAAIDHEHQGAYFVGARVGEIIGDAHVPTIRRFLELPTDSGGVHFGVLLTNVPAGDDREDRLEARIAAFRSGLAARCSAIRSLEWNARPT